jgi:DNA-binding LacI/PurR family transcriptional regulator
MPSQPTDPAGRIPRLKDIARESGYHITTVSLALREHASIPEHTRRKIRDIAERLGYQRNPVYYALSRFRQQGTVRAPAPRIGYLENFGQGSGLARPPHLEAIISGARRHAELLGYQLDPIPVGEDDHDSRSLTAYLRENRIQGLIISSFMPGCAEIALNWDDYAAVKIHSRHTQPDVTVIGNDQLREVREAFHRLNALGYQRIGLVVGRADEDGCGHRHTAGYLMEQAELAADRRVPPLLFPYSISRPALGAMIARWVRRHKIDAVLSNHGEIQTMLAAEGIVVPRDVGCAHLCLCPPAPSDAAGIQPRLDVVGERAVSIVVTQLKSTEHGVPQYPSSIYVQSVWKDGASAPPRVRR